MISDQFIKMMTVSASLSILTRRCLALAYAPKQAVNVPGYAPAGHLRRKITSAFLPNIDIAFAPTSLNSFRMVNTQERTILAQSVGFSRRISSISTRTRTRLQASISDESSVDAEESGYDENSGDWYEAGEDDDDDDIAEGDDTDEDEDELENEDAEDDDLNDLYERIRSSVQKATDTQTKKQNALQKELDKAKSLEDTMKRANLIISNLYQLPTGTKSAIVQDWDLDGEDVELILDHEEYNSAQEEADALFASARKMKRGSAVVGSLIKETAEALDILQDTVLDLDFAASESTSSSDGRMDEGRLYLLVDRLQRTSKQTGFVMKEASKDASQSSSSGNRSKRKNTNKSTRAQNTFRKFKSPGGCVVLVGRNRRDNEAICFKESRGDDIWMHSRGCPGAHVLLQVRRGSPRPTEECYQFAANLAAFYSDARTERRAPVTTASHKHIQKPRGAPLGAVKVRQELNTLTGCPADVDDQLKIAREQSGVIWDESGSRSLGGKAKNRKKTQSNAKQMVAKKRAEKKEKRKRKQSDSSAPESWY